MIILFLIVSAVCIAVVVAAALWVVPEWLQRALIALAGIGELVALWYCFFRS